MLNALRRLLASLRQSPPNTWLRFRILTYAQSGDVSVAYRTVGEAEGRQNVI